jgi:hypothetical protein
VGTATLELGSLARLVAAEELTPDLPLGFSLIGGRVARLGADPSQATGRVKRRDNQPSQRPRTGSSNPVPSSKESANFQSLEPEALTDAVFSTPGLSARILSMFAEVNASR